MPSNADVLVGALERQRHPVAGRLDLRDRVEAGPGERGGGVGVGRHLGVGGHDVDALVGEETGDLDQAERRLGRRAGRDRAARDVRAERRRSGAMAASRASTPGPPGTTT